MRVGCELCDMVLCQVSKTMKGWMSRKGHVEGCCAGIRPFVLRTLCKLMRSRRRRRGTCQSMRDHRVNGTPNDGRPMMAPNLCRCKVSVAVESMLGRGIKRGPLHFEYLADLNATVCCCVFKLWFRVLVLVDLMKGCAV